MTLHLPEWIVVSYCAYLAGASALLPLSSERRSRTAVQAIFTTAAVLWCSRFETGPGLVVRNLAPSVYLLAMYWLPAQLVTGPHLRFETMLASIDRRWMTGWGRARTVPRPALEALELAYALCYPLVPVGMACLYAGGAATEATRYWTAVLLSGALSYGMLPWLPTRSPRETSGEPVSMLVMRSVNLHVLRRGSVRWNTFPSGHVATSLAAALAVGVPLPWTGAALGVLALGIAVASVVGRYHYGADVVAGVGVALAAFAVSRFA